MQDDDTLSELPVMIGPSAERDPRVQERLQEYDWVQSRENKRPSLAEIERTMAILAILEDEEDDSEANQGNGWLN